MIVGARCNLRHIRESDLEALAPLVNNLAFRGAYLPCNLISPQELKKQYLPDSAAPASDEKFLIVDAQDNILGRTGYFKSVPHFDALEIGYHIFSPDDHGKGLATSAVQLLTDYIFRSRSVNRLEIRVNAANQASERVAIKCSFRKEGISRGAVFMNGSFVDIAVYALLRGEWNAAN